MRLHRVIPWVPRAGRGEAGHPLHVPPVQGAGRIDNPEQYLVLYASSHAEGAVAERFGNLGTWNEAMLEATPSLPGSVQALVEYEMQGPPLVDLDDPAALVERGLRPSEVVTRDRSVKERWALAIFREGRWSGVGWWSYHDPRWRSCGLWDRSGLRVEAVRALQPDDPALREAMSVLSRPWGD
ncbi:MAG: RES domain-containing protein [Actinobacteria bacterium]|nr:RES domain-containing protein [Actinomycetota bacterium]